MTILPFIHLYQTIFGKKVLVYISVSRTFQVGQKKCVPQRHHSFEELLFSEKDFVLQSFFWPYCLIKAVSKNFSPKKKDLESVQTIVKKILQLVFVNLCVASLVLLQQALTPHALVFTVLKRIFQEVIEKNRSILQMTGI